MWTYYIVHKFSLEVLNIFMLLIIYDYYYDWLIIIIFVIIIIIFPIVLIMIITILVMILIVYSMKSQRRQEAPWSYLFLLCSKRKMSPRFLGRA